MGHLDGERLATLGLPVLLEGRVVVLVEVAHHVVGDVEQGGGLAGAGGQQRGAQQGGAEQSFHGHVLGQGDDGGTLAAAFYSNKYFISIYLFFCAFGNSGWPQRLQKLASASWLGLAQVGQGCASPSLPLRMALASSAVKMPVGTAMIE
ncbi:hypothetical protein D3C78_1418670 [compost metagenome]